VSAPASPSRSEPPREPHVKDPLQEASEEVGRRGALGVAVLSLGVLVVLTFRYPWVMAIVVGIVLTVMLHEAGHYLLARRAGMKVTEFFLGFGPRIWSFKRGETEYGVKAIPAGGYVRIIGMNNLEEVDAADEPRTYREGSFGHRISVVLAGVTVNIILALMLLFVVFAASGVPDIVGAEVNSVQRGTPAARAGLESGDRVISIDGRRIDDTDDIPDALEDRAGELTTFVVERDGREQVIEVVPRQRSETDSSGFVGIGIASVAVDRQVSLLGAAGESFATIGRGTVGTADALADLFSPSGLAEFSENFTEDNPASEPSGGGSGGGGSNIDRPRGIVGIVDIGGEIADGNVWILLYLLAILNFALAFFNVIPLPPFDGGHAAVAIYEQIASKVKRREVRVDYAKLMPVTAFVLVVVLTLGLSVMYLDIRDAIGG
jgi:membrane-associated protease RseP (regulator of RpoE activity)